MKVKEEYVHDVVQRVTDKDGRERQIVWRGTADQISERIASNLRQSLINGDHKVIRLEPVAPYNIYDLEKGGF
jgi:hypothetical protein